MQEITLRVEPSTQAPRVSRSHLGELRHALGSRFDDVEMVLSELVTNSVRHGNGSGEISVEVGVSDATIRVQVTDQGPCFAKEDPRGEGMGLTIVDKIAERWGVERDTGCTVWVEIARE